MRLVGKNEVLHTRNGVKFQRHGIPSDQPPMIFLNGIGLDETQVGLGFTSKQDREIVALNPKDTLSRHLGAAALFMPTSMYEYAKVTKKAIDELISREIIQPNPDIVGLSWGSALAMQLNDDYPDSLGRTVAFSAPGPINIPDIDTSVALSMQGLSWMTGIPMSDRMAAEDLYAMNHRVFTELAKELGFDRKPNQISDIQQNQAIGMYALKLTLFGSKPKPNVLQVFGEDDRLSPPPRDKDAILVDDENFQLAPGTDKIILSRAGHMGIYTHPEITTNLIKQHLRRHETEPNPDNYDQGDELDYLRAA